MKRRSFLAGSITVPALGSAIATGALIRDPHLGWLNQWLDLQAAWRKSGENTAEEKELWGRAAVIEKDMSSKGAKTLQGALAQIEWILAATEPEDFQPGHRQALSLAFETLSQAA
ncbi:hypothetical protein MACH17_11460 [Phaeobacter inhibens]|uniref:hypothetical protein n=1 Tax=Phaeobacter inhibens TaxID=221822 RepID=UPI00275598DD|nr:hypothetical protein [Phaeobacter inhibens]GLO69629.1 hypothetical protein MACH17_11460 [Phaeobacter inhibens]